MIVSEDDYLMHYGILKRSGRYPWGSGGPETNTGHRSFLEYTSGLRASGMSDVEICKAIDCTVTELRAARTIANNRKKMEDIGMAEKLKAKGYSNVAIGERMGIPESSVRGLLAPGVRDRAAILMSTTNMLRDQVQQKGFLDVGANTEHQIGVSDIKLKAAVAQLREEGYGYHRIKVKQVGTGNFTTMKVLTAPGVHTREVYANIDKIQQINEHTYDHGRTFFGKQPPISIDSKRIAINYKEAGGNKADGVIYVRRGVDDLSLGGNHYAQVRIAVDGTHYLKGMAIYKDDMPPGVDLVFNTNKSSTGNKLDAMKPLKRDRDGNVDKDNPFGAQFDQLPKLREDGTEIKGTVRSAMNLVNKEGDWNEWSRNLSTQFLSKQSPTLAKTQLDMTYERHKNELDGILKLTNPAVKRQLLESFSDGADSSAVHMRAAALPRQRSQVILPVPGLKDNEIYARNFRDGERVVLVRHPHGGTFEIPELVVNNRNPQAKALLGSARDAVGINHKVAERLSGADFDGDTVLVIPNNHGSVRNTAALEQLRGFDPQAQYKAYEGMPKMTAQEKQHQMGMVSNLITDMTIRKASTPEIARAVKHSMVVIDAEKHNLDWRRSAQDNGIPALMKKYQPRTDGRGGGGSSTLISRATSDKRVLERKARPAGQGGGIDKATGEKKYVETGRSWVNAKGETVYAKTLSTKLAEATDAHELSSGTRIEHLYADHSNRMKALANQARKEMVHTQSTPYSPSAKEAYAAEVKSLNASLRIAQANAPRERQAQVVANATVKAKQEAYPDMTTDELKKVKAQALVEARHRTGAQKERVQISDKEWEAIQAGAISNNRLEAILRNADLERVKELATPREARVMTDTKKARARQMLTSGYTPSEIADQLGVPLSTLESSVLNGG